MDLVVFPENSYVEALTLSRTGFGDRNFKNIIKIK